MFGVQPIICHSRFCSGVLKIQRIEEFSLGFEGNGKFRKIYTRVMGTRHEGTSYGHEVKGRVSTDIGNMELWARGCVPITPYCRCQ